MKNFFKICVFALFIGQIVVAEQPEKRPVGRPKMIGPQLPPKTPGKVGRPPKNRGFILVNQNNDKSFTLVKQNNVPMIKPCNALTTINNVISVKTGVQKLTTGLRFVRGGIVGSLVGYAGAQAIDVLTDVEQRKAIAEKFTSNNIPKNFFTNELYKQEVGLEKEESTEEERSHVDIFATSNNSIPKQEAGIDLVPNDKSNAILAGSAMPLFLKYGSGAVVLTGLGYVAYKIYQKVYERYFKNNNTLNNKAI